MRRRGHGGSPSPGAFGALVACLVLAGSAAEPGRAHQQSSDVPRIEAIRTVDQIHVDGLLDEETWRSAPVATGFRQRNPVEGDPATERTEFQVALSAEALFVAVRAFDRQPEEIVALEMERDGALFRDDAIGLLLDTFHDHRNTYFFETNPNAARTDALITDEGRDSDFEWDGIWSVATHRDSRGWTAEFRIPFSTLRFNPQLDAWGLNVRRIIRRRNEFSFWSFIPLDAFVFRVSLYGHLTGVEPPEPGLNLQVKPFATGASVDTDSGSSDDLDLGLDVKWGLTRSLALDLTYNTDFAETEADSFQVNLSRFSLFFPEKRDFFLENSGIFQFGPGAPQLDLFFSRRIGIGAGGEEVPIDWGTRLTGRVGDWSLGLLDVETDEVSGGSTAAATPSARWSVLRARRNLGRRSAMGVMLTEKDAEGAGTERSFGFDTNLELTQKLGIDLFGAATDRPGADGQEWAAGVKAQWFGALWDWRVEMQEIGDAFEPAMGFVRRRGVRRYQGDLLYEPRPQAKAIRNYRFQLFADLVNRLDDSLESSSISLTPFGLELETGDEGHVFLDSIAEDLTRPFEIRPGIVIPPGRYDFDRHGLYLSSSSHRKVSADLTFIDGGFFDGDLTETRLDVTLRPNRLLRSETTWSLNDVALPAGDFETNLLRERVSLSFSPDLLLSALVQFNDEAELLAANVRFNWIYRPGADLFVVYNQSWDAPTLGNLQRRDRKVIVKFTYPFRH